MVRNFIVFILCLLMDWPSLAGTKTQIVRTKVEVFKPSVMPKKQHDGFCWSHSMSVMRNDAWRCMLNNEIFDPCFTTAIAKTLVCGVVPGNSKSGFLLKSTRPLPDIALIKPQSGHMWIAELEDGQFCHIYTGAMPVVLTKDKVFGVAYGCSSADDHSSAKKSGLLANSIVTGEVWQAKKITYVSQGKNQKNVDIQKVNIRKVWQ